MIILPNHHAPLTRDSRLFLAAKYAKAVGRVDAANPADVAKRGADSLRNFGLQPTWVHHNRLRTPYGWRLMPVYRIGANLIRLGGGGGVLRSTLSGDDLIHGQTATIANGVSVGSYEPFIYDDFSTGSLGGVIGNTAASVFGTWESDGGVPATNVTRSNAVSRGVHPRVSYHDFTTSTGSYNASLYMNDTFTGQWIADWWHRVDIPAANTNPHWTRNYKAFRWYEVSDTQDSLTLTYISPGPSDTPAGSTQFFVFKGTSGGSANNFFMAQNITESAWIHYRLQFNIGATYASDHLIFQWGYAGQALNEEYNGPVRPDASANDDWPIGMRIGHYWAHDDESGDYGANAGAQIYTSSVLVQHTIARVELGNHLTYASASIREPQPMFSDSTYQVNQGLLSSGTVYEYSFNASNTLLQTQARTMQ